MWTVAPPAAGDCLGTSPFLHPDGHRSRGREAGALVFLRCWKLEKSGVVTGSSRVVPMYYLPEVSRTLEEGLRDTDREAVLG